MPEKNDIFRRVNSLSDMERWAISQDAKAFDIKFESTKDSAFEQAYQCLTNFSNHGRIRFCFSEKLSNSKSDTLKKLIIESGDQIFFYDFLTQIDSAVLLKVSANSNTTWKKNWDLYEQY